MRGLPRFDPEDRPIQGRTNYRLSATLAKVVKARSGECEVNAIRALGHAPRGTRLVRGLANLFADERRWHQHAWLETRARQIIEVTPPYRQSSDVRYRPIQRLTKVEVQKLVALRETLGDRPIREAKA